ncbi:hypothetical protein C8R45DRAFT_85658 [Mycena sanguinolenta]|nr:hypothetical protein C8R45DRAFT_85658 [Mycena sanguinolenta]
MGQKTLTLVALPADVLLCILAVVDVRGIIALGQTCIALYSLIFSESKSVWLAVLGDLGRRGFIDSRRLPTSPCFRQKSSSTV